MEGEIITIETAQKLAEYDKLKKQYEKVLNDYCRLDAYNRTQKKEFINYLEDEINKEKDDLEKLCEFYKIPKKNNSAYKFAYSYINKMKEILQKYKSIIGDDK